MVGKMYFFSGCIIKTLNWFCLELHKGSRKKQKPQKFFSQWPGHKEGVGVKGRAIKENITFFGTFFSNVPTAIKLQGWRGVSLNGPSIKRRTFFGGFPKGRHATGSVISSGWTNKVRVAPRS